ncbi:hypothetical protein OPT61_g5202 [Boeremia exigua]|uniref:Uncharacterized protein n=1 Tax=Boeremia exigua TaxID=749465 RepID=A0ACC2IBB3_9PLEO|nr:hypothetical protein OPT61_g5202 [Boeremia exigua]
MPPNLSTKLTPVLLTDQFGLSPSNETNHFPTNSNVLFQDTHKYDDLIGIFTAGIVMFFIVLFKMYHVVTYNKPQWKLWALWRRYIRPKPSRHLSVSVDDDRSQFSPILGVSYSDDMLRDVEIGHYGSQDTTLEGSQSEERVSGRSVDDVSGQISIVESFPDFHDRFEDENGHVWIQLHPIQSTASGV